MGARIGSQGKLYYKNGTHTGGGAWIELTNVREASAPLTKNEADATTRANLGWDAIVATTKTGEINFEMVRDDTDPGFAFFRDRWFDDGIVGMQFLSAALADGGKGFQADFQVMNVEENQPLKDVTTVSVTVKVTYSLNPPVKVG